MLPDTKSASTDGQSSRNSVRVWLNTDSSRHSRLSKRCRAFLTGISSEHRACGLLTERQESTLLAWNWLVSFHQAVLECIDPPQ